MKTPPDMNLTDRAYLDALASQVLDLAPTSWTSSLYIAAEDTDFIRFNQARVRQATHVAQAYASLTLSDGSRAAQGSLTLSGESTRDTAALRAVQAELVRDLPLLPEDPHLQHPDTVRNTTRDDTGALPDARTLIEAVADEARGLDLVGLYAAGPMARLYADNQGQRNWHRVQTYSFDWCLYLAADKAVKAVQAGTHWSTPVWARQLAEGVTQLRMLGQAPRTLKPGRYRAYFSPAAMADLLGILAWGGFSHKEQAIGTSPLMRLVRGDAQLHPCIQLSEDVARSAAPAFTPEGFTRPPQVSLILEGRHAGSLCSPRSAREFGVSANGALAHEAPQALSLAPGTLAESEVLQALDTGLYISNLHYLNYSDRQHCRVTGMTRFACFWVERGELVAPLDVMRFDDDLLSMLGSRLLALTDQAVFQQDTGTYTERQLGSVTTPGALIEGFELTL